MQIYIFSIVHVLAASLTLGLGLLAPYILNVATKSIGIDGRRRITHQAVYQLGRLCSRLYLILLISGGGLFWYFKSLGREDAEFRAIIIAKCVCMVTAAALVGALTAKSRRALKVPDGEPQPRPVLGIFIAAGVVSLIAAGLGAWLRWH